MNNFIVDRYALIESAEGAVILQMGIGIDTRATRAEEAISAVVPAWTQRITINVRTVTGKLVTITAIDPHMFPTEDV